MALNSGGMFRGTNALTSPGKGIQNAQRGRDQYRKNINEGSNNLKKYTGKGNDSLMEAKAQAKESLQAGVDKAAPYLEQGVNLYKGLTPGDMAARLMYSNSLGLNGDAGNAAAVAAYHHNPGWDFALNEANQNVLRNGAATGNVASGNVLQALSDRAQGLQNQEYGSWQDRLANLGNNIYKDYAGMSGGLNDLASLFANEGSGLADIAMNTGGKLNQNWNSLGQNLNANNTLLAQNDYNRAANINNAQQSAAQNSQAQQQAWMNALTGLGGQLLSAGGSAGGLGNLFSFG